MPNRNLQTSEKTLSALNYYTIELNGKNFLIFDAEADIGTSIFDKTFIYENMKKNN